MVLIAADRKLVLPYAWCRLTVAVPVQVHATFPSVHPNPTFILAHLHPLSKARCTVQCVIVFRKWDRVSSVTLRMLSQFNVGLFWYRGTTALVLQSCLPPVLAVV